MIHLRKHVALIVISLAAIIGIAVTEFGMRSSSFESSAAEIEIPAGVFGELVEHVRHAPRDAISDTRSRAVVEGIVMGRTRDITAVDSAAFRASGLWHLLAASGQNVALIVVLCIGFSVTIGGGRHLGMMIALCAIPAYVVLVGGGPSIVRAGIMGEVGVLAFLAARQIGIAYAITGAGALMVWAWPGVHRLLGFQLSFACVIALALWSESLALQLRRWRIPLLLAVSLAASIVCTLVTSPLLMVRTGSAPLLGAVANVIAVPIASAILIIGLPASLVSLVLPGIGHAGLMLCAAAAKLLIMLAAIVAASPLASTSHPLLAIGMPVWLFLWWGQSRILERRSVPCLHSLALRHLICATCALLTAGMGIPGSTHPDRLNPPAQGQVRISILDVSQGMAALVQTHDHSILVDTGPPGVSVTHMIGALGVTRLDGVVLSHDSRDHRGNIDVVTRVLRPDWIVIPQHASGNWNHVRHLAPTSALCAGDHVDIEAGVRLSVLNPPCDHTWPSVTGDSHNDNAMVIVVEHRHVRVLLPADCEAPILKRLEIGAIDAIDVSHHGSRDPDLGSLLDSLVPRAAIISVGARNTYGHPSPQTIASLRERSIPVARTDHDGSVLLQSSGERLRIVSGIRLA